MRLRILIGVSFLIAASPGWTATVPLPGPAAPEDPGIQPGEPILDVAPAPGPISTGQVRIAQVDSAATTFHTALISPTPGPETAAPQETDPWLWTGLTAAYGQESDAPPFFHIGGEADGNAFEHALDRTRNRQLQNRYVFDPAAMPR